MLRGACAARHAMSFTSDRGLACSKISFLVQRPGHFIIAAGVAIDPSIPKVADDLRLSHELIDVPLQERASRLERTARQQRYPEIAEEALCGVTGSGRRVGRSGGKRRPIERCGAMNLL
jgi:hypothetical protein